MPNAQQTKQRSYQDLELTLVRAQEPHTYLVIADSNAGRASAHMRLDPTDETWRPLLEAVQREQTNEQCLTQLGARLFATLLPGDVEDAYRAARGHAEGAGQGLRVRLRLTEAPELAGLPWELVYDAQRQLFLGISDDTPLSRFIEPQQTFPPPPPPAGRLRLLTVLSDPQDLAQTYGLPRLRIEAELATLDTALQRLKSQNLLEEIPPLRHAVRADIAEALREYRPHALHFVSHGVFREGQGRLLLEDEDHFALEMSDAVFRELLAGQRDTRLVVLNTCQGAARDAGNALVGMGPQLVSRGAPAVVAMQFPIYERPAVSFTREFYRALAHWFPIDVAVSQARKAIFIDYGPGRPDWAAPVLFMRDRDGMLFEPPTQSPVSRPGIPDQAIDPAVLEQVCASYVEAPHKFYLPSRTRLLQILKTHFQLEELRELCVELGVDYENFAPTKDALARELVLYAERRSMARALIEAAYRRRPKAEW
jgi:hypothetical protein